jgi:hypothetical protein
MATKTPKPAPVKPREPIKLIDPEELKRLLDMGKDQSQSTGRKKEDWRRRRSRLR